MPRRLSAALAVGSLALTGLGFSASRAEAVVTGTTISTSSYSAAFTLVPAGRAAAARMAPALELAGSYARAGDAPDGVDARCYDGSASSLIGTQSAPAGNTFRVSGPVPVGSICDLRAVPSGTAPSAGALAGYPALRQAFDYAGTTAETPTSGAPDSAPGINAATQVHVEAGLPQASAVVTLGDAAAAGPAPAGGVTTRLLGADLDSSAGPVFSSAGELPTDGASTSPGGGQASGGQAGGIRVDGVNVLSPGAAADIWGTDSRQPSFPGGVSVASSINAQTGDATVVTSEPLLVCPIATLPATKATCPSFAPVGVTLDRTITTSQAGRVVRVTDSFASAQAHAISLDYSHTVGSTAGPAGQAAEFSTDGGASYVVGTQGVGLAVPAAPFSVLVKTDGEPTSFAHPAGSVTYSTQPTSAVFANGGATLVTHYDRAIPAGGSLTLTHSYVSGDDAAAIQRLSAYALGSGLLPGVALSVPASVSSRKVMLSGVATPGQNGLPVTVSNPGSGGGTAGVDPHTGAFAVPAVLRPGAQTVSVNAVDAVGGSVTSQAVLSYDNPLLVVRYDHYLVFSTHRVTVAKRVGKRIVVTRPRVRYVSGVRLLVALHCLSTATSACTAKIVISSRGKTLKTVLFTRGPGYRPVVSIPLTASAYGSFGYDGAHSPKPTKRTPHPRATSWTIGVRVSYTDPDGSSYPGSVAGTRRI